MAGAVGMLDAQTYLTASTALVILDSSAMALHALVTHSFTRRSLSSDLIESKFSLSPRTKISMAQLLYRAESESSGSKSEY